MDVVINDKRKIIIHGIAYWIRVKEVSWLAPQSKAAEALSNEETPVSEDPFGIYGLLHKNNNNNSGSMESVDPKFPPGFTQQEEIEADIFFQSHFRKTKLEIRRFLYYPGGLGAHVFDSRVGPSGWISGGHCTWVPSSTRLLVISIYSPQELSEKRDLWNYLQSFISRWDGETVLMGDFNEVRSERKRFGSVFNQQGATAFNQFISSSSLIDPPLDGYAFTWSHKNASKMSKLDRFLLSEGLFDFVPATFLLFA
ncbi:RNA-directed DNA polymerase, eukaryota [Tanacetum coccineum]